MAEASRLMFGTMSRAVGTSSAAPGSTKKFCMSMTTSAVRRRVEFVDDTQCAHAPR